MSPPSSRSAKLLMRSGICQRSTAWVAGVIALQQLALDIDPIEGLLRHIPDRHFAQPVAAIDDAFDQVAHPSPPLLQPLSLPAVPNRARANAAWDDGESPAGVLGGRLSRCRPLARRRGRVPRGHAGVERRAHVAHRLAQMRAHGLGGAAGVARLDALEDAFMGRDRIFRRMASELMAAEGEMKGIAQRHRHRFQKMAQHPVAAGERHGLMEADIPLMIALLGRGPVAAAHLRRRRPHAGQGAGDGRGPGARDPLGAERGRLDLFRSVGCSISKARTNSYGRIRWGRHSCDVHCRQLRPAF